VQEKHKCDQSSFPKQYLKEIVMTWSSDGSDHEVPVSASQKNLMSHCLEPSVSYPDDGTANLKSFEVLQELIIPLIEILKVISWTRAVDIQHTTASCLSKGEED
jgi:hypothetical protein